MLLSVNTVVHLAVKVDIQQVTINGLSEWLFTARDQLFSQLVGRVVTQEQEQWLDAVSRAQSELICTGCGVVHRGRTGWTRRGSRTRRIKTSSGTLAFPLLQVTCRDCGATRTPCAPVMGVAPQQRITTELKRKAIERVFETSYHRSARAIRDCMGVSVSATTLHRYVQDSARRVQVTPAPECIAVLADAAKVRAGSRAECEDLRFAFQLTARSGTDSRRRAHLRVVGVGIGLRSWPQVLPGDEHTALVVTDGEPALEAHVRKRYPNARHQFCMWHAVYSLDYSLLQDRIPVQQRKGLRKELAGVLWRKASLRRRRRLYESYIERLSYSRTSQTQLRRAAAHLLFEEASAEVTTSLIERQMREVDRRTWVGARWSTSGVRNLMLLSMLRRHNADHYAPVWQT